MNAILHGSWWTVIRKDGSVPEAWALLLRRSEADRKAEELSGNEPKGSRRFRACRIRSLPEHLKRVVQMLEWI